MTRTRRARLATVTVAISIALFALAASYFLTTAQQHRLASASYAPAPDGMVFVPAGTFLSGGGDEPARSVFLPAYYIDRHEITNAHYKAFDPAHTYPEGQDNYPVTGISKENAQAYAHSLGQRLPTALEWEKAARGVDGRAYPWGNDFRDGYANIDGGADLQPVGSHPQGVSPYGLHDMTGNAWEWTSDVFVDKAPGSTPIHRNIIRGGGYSYPPFQGATYYPGYESVGATCNDLGFRCAKDASPE